MAGQCLARTARAASGGYGLGLPVFVAIALLWWLPYNNAAHLQIDEASYFRAFALLQAGESPYDEPSYLYPPLVAVAGAWLVAQIGERSTALLLRQVNLIGGCLAVWLSLCLVAWPRGRVGEALRVLVAVALVVLAPPLTSGITRGNLSLLAAGLAIAGLVGWPVRPGLAGTSLGFSLVLKPMAVLAPACLLLHRCADPRETRAARLAGAAAISAAALLLVPGARFLPGMFGNLGGNPTAVRVTSLHRVLHGLGVELPALALAAAIAALLAGLLLRAHLKPPQLLALAVAGSLLALPVVWPHTLLLALPLQVLAAALAAERRRGGAPLGEAVLVGCAVAAIFLSDGFGAIEQPAWLATLLVALPTLAPAALATYLLLLGESR